jgi:DNA-binding NarL/FixJ family response regulator
VGLYDSIHRDPVPVAAVAVVSPDELLALRIRDALAAAGIAVAERAADVSALSAATGRAGAIVLAGRSTAPDQRACIRAAVERFPGIPPLLVASVSATGVRKALDAGACGVVLERAIELALGAAVRAVCSRQVVVPHGYYREAVRPPLSHREKEALALAARGLTNSEIAAELFLAESTIKSHLSSVFRKLGVDTRSEAAALLSDPNERLRLGLPT